ncbi:MAG: acetyltransferase [Alphaproteobacteria bacterium]|jgi:RimJ/RimL family protein N-acetyltransferase|nr:acetyltransferase [Alphaproteobacteria bacterium]
MITFRKATLPDLPLLDSWLQKPHVREFWDNSERQYTNMKNYLEGTKHIHDYYIGLMDGAPYCLLLTCNETIEPDTPLPYLPYLSKDRNIHSLDFMIGEEAYLSKGFGPQTLQAFCLYIQQHDPLSTRFIIDPQSNNPRAIHVYEKAGFQKVGTFTPEEGEFAGILTHIMVKDLEIK